MDMWIYIFLIVLFLVLISYFISVITKIPFIFVFLINLLTGGLGIIFFLILCLYASFNEEEVKKKKKKL